MLPILNFDNWAYQPSYVSSNTPWFFNGVRVQIFPSDKLKIEPWLINGWQSYAKFNDHPGLGLQILWRPTGWLSVLSNNYGYGTDTPGQPGRTRWHTDDSLEIKYLDSPASPIGKGAFLAHGQWPGRAGARLGARSGEGGDPHRSGAAREAVRSDRTCR